MLTSLRIVDLTTTSIGKKTEHSFTVRVSGEKIQGRELLRLRIFQEVEDYNSRQPAVFNMLVQPGETERTLNGYRFAKPRLVNPEAQFKKAVEAFESNGFIMLVDKHQLETLEEEIALQPETTVSFLKLVPLVGG